MACAEERWREGRRRFKRAACGKRWKRRRTPTLYRWRAEAQLEADDRRGARKSLGEALRLMPDDLRSRLLLVELKGSGI